MVERVADRLHLRQDQPALRRLHVDRHDHHDRITRPDQVAQQRRSLDEIFGAGGQQRILQQRQHPFAFRRPAGRGDAQRLEAALLLQHRQKFRRGRLFVDFVDDRNQADLAVAGGCEHILFRNSPDARAGHQQQHVGPVERAFAAFDPAAAEGGLIVDAGGVEEKHRAERPQFHRFFHHIGGGAGNRGGDRDILAGDQVQEAGFAGIGASGDGDLQTHGAGGAFHIETLL